MQRPIQTFSIFSSVPRPVWHALRVCCLVAGAVLVLCGRAMSLHAQGISAPPRPTSILLPEANRVPDANDRMKMNNAFQRKQNFDAANALRQKQMGDESTKLLILANDLKQQMESWAISPFPINCCARPKSSNCSPTMCKPR